MTPQPSNMENPELRHLVVYGLLPTNEYQKVKCCALDLYKKHPNVFKQPDIHGMLEFKWAHWLEQEKKELKDEVWAFDDVVMIFCDHELIGGARAFNQWAAKYYNFEDFRNEDLYETLRKEEYAAHLASTGDNFVYLDISIDNEPAGRLLIQLFKQVAPKTCQNFLLLCTGENGISSSSSHKLHYKNSIFHRIVPNGWIQGGDIWSGKGNGSESAFGGFFEDESFAIAHNERGIIGMANDGRHTNGSQFYITLNPSQWMDKKYVAFGQIVEGSKTLKSIESLDTVNERPKNACKIDDCGVFEFVF